MNITNFEKVNELYAAGKCICKGCAFEHAASCDETRLSICNHQYHILFG